MRLAIALDRRRYSEHSKRKKNGGKLEEKLRGIEYVKGLGLIYI